MGNKNKTVPSQEGLRGNEGMGGRDGKMGESS